MPSLSPASSWCRFKFSNSQWIIFVLLRCEIKDVVHIHNDDGSDNNDCAEGYKAHTVVDCRSNKGQQEYPEDNIISLPNEGEWVCERLFD